ncbi:MAG TPA: primosomal protein N' [Cytophagaceae bacterium]|nr:primosomal protein N' [Cytophagaceae bacterium]
MESKLEFNTHTPEGITTLFADVILPLPLPKLYTYRVPHDLNDKVSVGARAIVQFGKKKVLTSIIAAIHQQPPALYEAKYILDLLDEEPLMNSQQLKLYEWMSQYYMCNLGEVINAALPSGLKLNSESRIQLNPDYNNNLMAFTGQEEMIIQTLLVKESLSYNEAAHILGLKSINPIIKSLLAKERIILYEEIREKYVPKKIKKLKLSQEYNNKVKLEALFKELEKKPKQTEVLLRYLQQVPVFNNPALNKAGLERISFINLLESASAYNTLFKKNVFEEFELIVPRFGEGEETKFKDIKLTDAQEKAKTEILDSFKSKETVLLHGITGSGKTEVFIELIKNALDGGSQVLYLLPEIALTTQIVQRLRKVFGNKMGVYHSKFSDNERVDIWKGLISGKLSFIVGVRSSIFLPFDNLGLIIIDEEHETSYKQYDPAPRYHARDTSLMLAKLHNAKTVLGSATPSIESYYNAITERWGLVKLSKRFGDAELPEIILADTRKERRNKTMRNDFSGLLVNEIKSALERKEQAILFQNRRGYSPYISCEDCAYIPKCQNCDVSLTLHMYSQDLRCHYCGHTQAPPINCPACGSGRIKSVGFGTEKIEEDIKLFIPEANVQRMDLDTTRKKNSYENIIGDFEKGKTNILVGTQMVSKGLDFDKVSLVGIFDADRMIHFPDFRSHERAFQMMTQVSGRAGRKAKKGRVIIQTADTEQALLKKVISNDYEGLYKDEIAERENFLYPPFCRIIKLTFKDIDRKKVHQGAQGLSELLKERLGGRRILGPEAPLIDRLRNYYLMDIFIKIEKDISLKAVKFSVGQTIQTFLSDKDYKNSYIQADVDPV